MKNKIGIIIAVIAIVGIAAGGYFLIKKPSITQRLLIEIDAKKEASQSLARFTPKDVVAFYSISNIEKTWNQLKNSQFWKQFSSLSIWNNENFQNSLKQFQDDFKTNFGFAPGEGTLLDLFGKELALAVLPMSAESTQPNVLLLSQIGGKAKLTEKIFKFVEGTMGEEGQSNVQTIKYGNAEITHFAPQTEGNPSVFYTIQGDTLVLGIGDTQKAIENAIDIAANKSNDSLAQSQVFQDIIRSTTLGHNTIGRFYMNFNQISSFISALSAIPGGAPLAPNVAEAFAVLKTLGGTTVLEDSLMTRIAVTPNKEKMDAQTQAMWATKPAKPASLKFIPSGTYLYSASCSLDVNALWTMWLGNLDAQNPQQAQLIKDGIQNFEQAIGMSIEKDILSWIGNEAAYVFNEVSTQGLFPIPKMAILVKVENKKVAENFLGKLVDSVNKQAETLAQPTDEGAAPGPIVTGFKLQISKEAYKGIELNILEIPFLGKAIAPGYAFVDDFLIISTNTGSLQKMIETYKGSSPSLESDAAFKMVAPILGHYSNQIVYADISKILDAGIEISNWIVSFQALQPPPEEGAAPGNQQFIQENLIPLLRSLKSIKTVGINTLYTSHGIEQTFVTKFEDQ